MTRDAARGAGHLYVGALNHRSGVVTDGPSDFAGVLGIEFTAGEHGQQYPIPQKRRIFIDDSLADSAQSQKATKCPY